MLPDRLKSLMAKIQGGEAVTQQELNRFAALQGLACAKAGRDFVEAANEREQKQIELLQQHALAP